MNRASYFGEMSYARLARLLSDKELYLSRQSQCGESVVRFCSFMQFCCVSLFSLVTVMTPWMLSAAELVIMLVLYFTVVLESVKSIKDSNIVHDHFKMSENLNDIVICSVVRVILLSISYAFAFKRYRPYYIIAWLTSLVLIPYAIIKAILINRNPVGETLALILISILFSVVHVIVAHATMKRLQRRMNMGLSGFDSPWDEEDWVMNGSVDSYNTTDAIQELFLSADDDIPRDVLTDLDSKFIDCDGLSVHYKEEYPEDNGHSARLDSNFAVVLIHGYGGGVFAWRNVMKPLAETCRCRVIAFDRPAFGLTARPKCDETSKNPYTLQSQQSLVLDLCSRLGIKRAMLVAHSDGCMLALMLGAALNPLNNNIPRRISDKTRRLLKSGSSQKREGSSHVMIGLPIRRSVSEVHDKDLTDVPEEVDLESGNSPSADVVLRPAHSGLSILTMVFLHPDLSCDDGPSFTNLLRQSKIARKVLRPLLRSDIGEVASRRAWYDTSKLTKEILDLYKSPLRIRGWDSALVAYTKERKMVTNEQIKLLTQRVVGLPMLVVTGEKDRIVPPEKAAAIAEDLRAEHRDVLSNCGHLSHEEVPDVLLQTLAAYVHHICELYEGL